MLPDSSSDSFPNKQELPAAKLGSPSVQGFRETKQGRRPTVVGSRGPAGEARTPKQGNEEKPRETLLLQRTDALFCCSGLHNVK